ncbi:hypothetical protein [Frateuria defendens]|uniref:hypothetical protein n=1 Tax=Frateuria defendens TaxID=2219559 RepID=UPI001293C5A4|nr:hypothetical protein [Frateuria defendens]
MNRATDRADLRIAISVSLNHDATNTTLIRCKNTVAIFVLPPPNFVIFDRISDALTNRPNISARRLYSPRFNKRTSSRTHAIRAAIISITTRNEQRSSRHTHQAHQLGSKPRRSVHTFPYIRDGELCTFGAGQCQLTAQLSVGIDRDFAQRFFA